MLPNFIEFMGLRIHSFSLFFSLGFAVATVMVRSRARVENVPQERVVELLILMVLAGIVGARACYVIEAAPYFENRWLEAMMPWRGGLSFYGGLIGCIVAGTAYCVVKELPPGQICDLFIPYAALGHAFGRLGCLSHGCCYGGATDVVWAVAFPRTAHDDVLRHPTQAYEALGLTLLFLVLTGPARRWAGDENRGRITAVYLMGYGALRFGLESLRADAVGARIHGLLPYQWVSVVIIMAGLATWTASRIQRRSTISSAGLELCA